jgi:TIR domain
MPIRFFATIPRSSTIRGRRGSSAAGVLFRSEHLLARRFTGPRDNVQHWNAHTSTMFLSATQTAPVADWVRNHFYPLLAQWLPECTPVDHEPAIFVDFNSIDTGAEWPVSIRRALKQSRCLVPVFCPASFRSAWCCSELETMRQREAAVGLRTEDHPHGLIYPVVFWDGEFFPEHARTIQQRNLSRWADPYPTFSQTVAYSEFLATIRTICQEIAGLILAAPMFDPAWPTLQSRPSAAPRIPLPRVR